MSIIVKSLSIEIAGNESNVNTLIAQLEKSLAAVKSVVVEINGTTANKKSRRTYTRKAKAKKPVSKKAVAVEAGLTGLAKWRAEQKAKKEAKAAKKGKPSKDGKRTMSKAGAEAIRAAAKKRWAAFRKAKKAGKPAPKKSKAVKPVTKKAIKVK
jgi:hypothetical protein